MVNFFAAFPSSAHPMASLSAMVCSMSAYYPELIKENPTPQEIDRIAAQKLDGAPLPPNGRLSTAGAQLVTWRMKCQRRSPSSGRNTSAWMRGAKRRSRAASGSPRAASSSASAASLPALLM